MNRIHAAGLALALLLPLAASGRVPRRLKGAAGASAVTMRLDYSGAEALLDALERDSLSEADVDELLRVPGLRAMVDNVTRFIPGVGAREFREEVRAFVRRKEPGRHGRIFQLADAWRERARVRALVAALRADERGVVRRTLARPNLYRPDTGPLPITVYFVAGGVSDGFVFEADPGSFYINLVRAGGDLNGVVENMTHEAYHSMQFAAQARAGLPALWVSNEGRPPAERLFAGVLSEGTANYVADPTRSRAAGPNMEGARALYRRNAEPARVAENFALFDAVLRELLGGRIDWAEAYRRGFSRDNDDRFYFVGYEMAKALERHCGRGCIGEHFGKPPVEFFRRYVALYRRHPDIGGRFSPETEGLIMAPRRAPGP